MRYSVFTLSAALFLGATSLASAQSLRDDLDRMTGETPVASAPYSAPNAVQNPQIMGHDYTSEPRSAADVNVAQLAALNQPAPDFALIMGNGPAAGTPFGLRNLVGQGPAVVLFAPGSVQYTYPLLGLLEKNLGNFQRVGIQPIAISTDPVAVLSAQNYSYAVLSDPSGVTMRHYGAIKQGGMVTPVLVSIDANGVIVDMQETLSPDLNRAVAALPRVTQQVQVQEQVTTVTTETVTATGNVAQPQQLIQIQQVSRADDVVVNNQGTVLGAREVLASTSESIEIQPFPSAAPQGQQQAPAQLIPAPGQAIPVIPPSFPQ